MNVSKALGIKTAAQAAAWCDGSLNGSIEESGRIAISRYERGGYPCAAVFRGPGLKAKARYRFPSVEKREAWVAEQVAAEKRSADADAARRAVKKIKVAAFVMPYKVGDVLYGSWGYDQTNVEFYEVVGIVGKRMIEIRALKQCVVEGSEGFMCEHVMAATGPDRFYEDDGHPYNSDKAKVLRKVVDVDGGVKLYDFGCWLRKEAPGAKHYQSHYA